MPPKKQMTFEERLRRLQEVVAALEGGGAAGAGGNGEELSLEESVRLYKEGLELSRACREQLENVRNEIRLLTEDGGLAPFTLRDAEASSGQSDSQEEM